MTNAAFRKTHVGGSDIPTILGLNPDSWGTIIDLWRIKTGLAEPQPPNEYMKRGIALEPEAREAYMQFTGRLVSPVEDMESKDYPFCSASLDGWTPAGDLVSEFKCPTGTKTLLLAQDGKIQANYYAQVQWQMFVTGTAKTADFWVYRVSKDANGKKIITTALIEGIKAKRSK